MIAEKWEQIKDRFEQALELSPEERQSFLADLTREDPTMASEVAQLLHAHEEAGDFLLQPCSLASDFLEDLELEEYRFSPGDVLCGRFHIVHLIGRGGMGEVYKAWDEELEDHVALKTLRLEISTHELFTSRFRREIQLARKVTHPNVCRIFDSFKHPISDGTYISVLSMELLPGQTLAEYLKAKGRLTSAEALPLVRQIIAGLSAIHAAGIIHRDLKPSNLMLVPEGVPAEATSANFQIKITDFGIAGRLPDGLSPAAQTEVSKLMGTPDYMAPEQLEHARASVQSDIYSLGLVLYEMVTGVKPFAGTSAWRRTTADPPPVRKFASDLPENWNKTIACCLERNPQYRFQSAQTALDSLEGDACAAKIPPKPLHVRLKRAAKARRGLIAIIFLLAMALTTRLYRYLHQSPEVSTGTALLLTNLRNETNDPYFLGATAALKSQLSQSAHFEVEVAEDTRVIEALKKMQRSAHDLPDFRIGREAALLTGSPSVVFGTLKRKHPRGYMLSISLELVKSTADFPAARWEKNFDASNETDLLKAVHAAATWIRSTLGEPALQLNSENRPPAEITTGSWSAWRLLNQANTMVEENDYKSAERSLRGAIEEDPEFPEAHMRLADILISMRRDRDGLVEWEQTRAAIQKREHDGAPLADRENLRIKGEYAEDTGRYTEARTAFEQLTSLYPSDFRGWFYLGSVLDKTLDRENAIKALSRAIALRPEWSSPYAHLAMVYIALNNLPIARDEARAAENAGAVEWAAWLRTIIAFTASDENSALTEVGTLVASDKDDFNSPGYLMQAMLLADFGRYREAMATLEKGIEFDRAKSKKSGRDSKSEIPGIADKLIGLAYLHYRNKEFSKCRSVALEAAALDSTPRHLLETGSLLTLSGDVAGARKLLAKMQNDKEIQQIPFVKFVIAKLTREIVLAGRSADLELYFMRAMQTPLTDDKRWTGSDSGEPLKESDTARSLREVVDDRAHNLMYRDHDFPGLWSESLKNLILLRQVKPAEMCAYRDQFLKMRRHRDALEADAVSRIQHLMQQDCTGGH
jgi:serine/threonine protein kinase/Flp pilus assembly protein TadD